jgi:hypothetical protein
MLATADIETVARGLARREAHRTLTSEVASQTLEIIKLSVRSFEEDHWRDFTEEARRYLSSSDPCST